MDLLDIRKKAKGLKPTGEASEAGPDQAEAPEKKTPPRRRKAAAPRQASEEGPIKEEEPRLEAPEAATPAPVAEPPAAAGPGPEEEAGGGVSADDDVVEYLAFMLASEEYAVKVEEVGEIIRPPRITTVPRAPEFVKGIISLRGVIIPVFDIKKRLGLGETERARTARVIVVSDGGTPQGIMVDRVTGVARLRAGGIEPPPAVIGGVDAEYLEGVGRDGDRLLILFNTGKVLAMEG